MWVTIHPQATTTWPVCDVILFVLQNMSFVPNSSRWKKSFKKCPNERASCELGQIYMWKTYQIWLAKSKENLVFQPLASPSKNIPGIPVESRRNSGPHLAGLVWNSRWIPGGFRVKSAGIPRNYCRHSPGILPVFHRNSRLLRPEFCRNYCRHSAGIPPEFRWNYCRHSPRHSTRIPGRNSAGIIAGIPPVFRRNYCRHSLQYSTGIIAGIPPVFHRNSAGIIAVIPPGIPPEFRAGILPELLLAFPRYPTGILGWNSTGIIAGILLVFHRNSGLKFCQNYCRHSPGIRPDSGGVIASIVAVFIRK